MQTDYRIATVKEDKKMNRKVKNDLLLALFKGYFLIYANIFEAA